MNNQGLSFTNIIINLVIVAGLAFLGYLGFQSFFLNKPSTNEAIINTNESTTPNKTTTDQDKVTPPIEPKNTSPVSNIKPSPTLPARDAGALTNIIETPPANTSTISLCPGLYRNYTYFYSLECPTSCPLKVRTEAEVAIGTVPPKNGLGAIIIEVSDQTDNELKTAKAEAAKYPSMVAIYEEPIQLGGQAGDKITLDYLVTGSKSFYILVPYAGLNYLIIYSSESDAFIREVENILDTFKFE